MAETRNNSDRLNRRDNRKAGETNNWEVLGPRQNLGHEDEWFLSKVDGGAVETVHERDLESGAAWSFVPDDD